MQKISVHSRSNTPGIDGQFFKTKGFVRNEYLQQMLKGSKYAFSKKSLKVKKDLPKKARITTEVLKCIQHKLVCYNTSLKFILLKQCNIKSLRGNYRAHSVKRIRIERLSNNGIRSLDICTLRDRVLQQVIYFSMLPIVEYESDVLSFGFRPGKTATQAISFIYSRLIKSNMFYNSSCTSYRTTKEVYDNYKGRKSKYKLNNISGNSSKRRRRYRYQY